MSTKCNALVARTGEHGRWHGPAHRRHARCVRSARRNEARQRQFLYDARKRARAS